MDIGEAPASRPDDAVQNNGKNYCRSDLKTEAHNNRKQICNECGHKFCDKFSLMRHIKLHQRILDHECSICDKKFAQKKALQRHMTILHLGIRKHECPQCSQRFSTKANLQRHIKNLHPEDQEVQANSTKCSVCGCFFRSKKMYSAHIIKHRITSKTNITYEIKTERNVSKLKLLDSTEEHSNDLLAMALDKSGVVPEVDIETARIVIVDGKRRFKCDMCELSLYKFSALRRHMMTHSNSYKCRYCDKFFNLLSDLRKHLKKVHEIKCISNVNTKLWNALNDPNSDLLQKVTKSNISCKNKTKSNTLKMRDCGQDKMENFHINENISEIEPVEKLSMPILDDELEQITEIDQTIFTSTNNSNQSNNKEDFNKFISEKTTPFDLINIPIKDTNNLEIFNNWTASKQNNTTPLLRDALIAQSNVPLIEGMKIDSSKIHKNQDMDINLPEDLICLPICKTIEDDVICSYLFDSDLINTKDNEGIDNFKDITNNVMVDPVNKSISENVKVDSANKVIIENVMVDPAKTIGTPHQYDPINIISEQKIHSESGDNYNSMDQVLIKSQYNGITYNADHNAVNTFLDKYTNENISPTQRNYKSIPQEEVDINLNENNNFNVSFNINELSLESNYAEISITDIIEGLRSDTQVHEMTKNDSLHLNIANEMIPPQTDVAILNNYENEMPIQL